jgi:hypothetical protein
MASVKVRQVHVVADGPCSFVVETQAGIDTYFSTSIDVLVAVLTAFFSRADVDIVLLEGTKVAQRVLAFEVAVAPAPIPVPMGWHVNRMATQRTTGVGDHLEVFLLREGSTVESAFNVFDPSLKQTLMAAAFTGSRFRIEFVDDVKQLHGIQLG